MRNRKHDGNKSSVVNFGVQGWVTILYCLLMFWLYAGMVNSGSNFASAASSLASSNRLTALLFKRSMALSVRS